jgi:hypothetical protein
MHPPLKPHKILDDMDVLKSCSYIAPLSMFIFVSSHSHAKISLPIRASLGGSNSSRAQLLVLCSCCSEAFHL